MRPALIWEVTQRSYVAWRGGNRTLLKSNFPNINSYKTERPQLQLRQNIPESRKVCSSITNLPVSVEIQDGGPLWENLKNNFANNTILLQHYTIKRYNDKVTLLLTNSCLSHLLYFQTKPELFQCSIIIMGRILELFWTRYTNQVLKRFKFYLTLTTRTFILCFTSGSTYSFKVSDLDVTELPKLAWLTLQ